MIDAIIGKIWKTHDYSGEYEEYGSQGSVLTLCAPNYCN